MRRKIKDTRTINPDPVYESVLAAKFINHLMWDGKKSVAEKIFYKAVAEASKKTKKEPIKIFEEAVQNVAPIVEVRPRRVGGANYQVPLEVPKKRQISLAMRWIISAARNKKGKPMWQKLADEFIEASKKQGDAYKKREDTHKMAEANRAFAHFAWGNK